MEKPINVVDDVSAAQPRAYSGEEATTAPIEEGGRGGRQEGGREGGRQWECELELEQSMFACLGLIPHPCLLRRSAYSCPVGPSCAGPTHTAPRRRPSPLFLGAEHEHGLAQVWAWNPFTDRSSFCHLLVVPVMQCLSPPPFTFAPKQRLPGLPPRLPPLVAGMPLP